MARRYVNEMDKRINSINLASAPRSTEIVLSHGHATPIEEFDGTVVPIIEKGLAEGQYERSIQDTNEDEAIIYEVEIKDSTRNEMLERIMPCSMPMGTIDVLDQDDSSDLGSLMEQGANGLRDGDLALADLQPGHPIESKEDRRMMMNGHGSEHVQNTCGTRWGSSPDDRFTSEPRMD